MNGKENLILEAKSALFDAMRALGPHRNSVILVGAQAVYQHTGTMNLAVAEFTRDSDLVLDVSMLADAPEISNLLKAAGFYQAIGANPGAPALSMRVAGPSALMIAGKESDSGIRDLIE